MTADRYLKMMRFARLTWEHPMTSISAEAVGRQNRWYDNASQDQDLLGLDIESGGNDRGFDLEGAICNLDIR